MHFKMSSAICFNLDQSKMLSSGNGLRTYIWHERGPAWPSGKVFDSGSWVRAALDPLGFFHGSVLGQDTSEPQPVTGETQERHE